jgi:hypothetical protein
MAALDAMLKEVTPEEIEETRKILSAERKKKEAKAKKKAEAEQAPA